MKIAIYIDVDLGKTANNKEFLYFQLEKFLQYFNST